MQNIYLWCHCIIRLKMLLINLSVITQIHISRTTPLFHFIILSFRKPNVYFCTKLYSRQSVYYDAKIHSNDILYKTNMPKKTMKKFLHFREIKKTKFRIKLFWSLFILKIFFLWICWTFLLKNCKMIFTVVQIKGL